jgi:hypothetical protein
MLNVEGQWQEGKGVMPKLPIKLGHIEEKSFLITQMEVILHSIVYSELPVMIGPCLIISREFEGFEVIN